MIPGPGSGSVSLPHRCPGISLLVSMKMGVNVAASATWATGANASLSARPDRMLNPAAIGKLRSRRDVLQSPKKATCTSAIILFSGNFRSALPMRFVPVILFCMQKRRPYLYAFFGQHQCGGGQVGTNMGFRRCQAGHEWRIFSRMEGLNTRQTTESISTGTSNLT